MKAALCLLTVVLGLIGSALAETAVSLQLILAVDASGSVDATRFALQQRGYAAAFRDKQVQAAIRSTGTGSIAVAMLQWTGPSLQVVVADWVLLDRPAAADRFAAAIDHAPRVLHSGGTSISGAIDFAMTLFPASPFQAPRRVIDISGDGANNRGRPAEDARDAAIAAGATINGLPILSLEPELDRHYRDSVIGGPGAFLIVAREYQEFALAIRAKLITEIAGAASGDRIATPEVQQFWLWREAGLSRSSAGQAQSLRRRMRGRRMRGMTEQGSAGHNETCCWTSILVDLHQRPCHDSAATSRPTTKPGSQR